MELGIGNWNSIIIILQLLWTMSSRRGSPRRRALADATAGVVGSLVSVLCFYPVDVWKTSLQAAAGRASPTSANDDPRQQMKTVQNQIIPRHHYLIAKLLSIKSADLFRGLHHKVAHTIVSSFTYFYVYSLVHTKYLTYRRGNGSPSTQTPKISTAAKLLLTAFSAMINTAITLPFDTMSSRIQAGHDVSASHEESQYQSHAEEHNNSNGCFEKMKGHERLYMKKYSLNTNIPKEAFEIRKIRNTTIDNSCKDNHSEQLKSILSLWNGLLPALLLCTNPAIQYTMFENLKSALLQHRFSQKQDDKQRLSMGEAFVFGLISKFFATIMTYPLIRAKVMLMVSSPNVFEDHKCKDESQHSCQISRTDRSNGETKTKKYPRSLPLLLISIFRNDGIRGLYRGCSVQLLHTIMKSALMLMIRERITSVCHQFFLEDSP